MTPKIKRRVTFTMEIEIHPEGRAGDFGAILAALCTAVEMGPQKLWRMGLVKIENIA